MADYIDRSELIIELQKKYDALYGRRPDFYMGYQIVCGYVENFQTADVAPVQHGHWTSKDIVSRRAGYGVRYYNHAECVINPCGLVENAYDYCPYCGARMDGGADNGERRCE